MVNADSGRTAYRALLDVLHREVGGSATDVPLGATLGGTLLHGTWPCAFMEDSATAEEYYTFAERLTATALRLQ